MTTYPSPLKILHILDHSLPLHSGYAFRSHDIFRAQRQRGWNPVTLTSPKHEESWKGELKKEETVSGFSYYRTDMPSRRALPLVAEFRLMAALARRVREVALAEKPDLLHVHSPVLNAIPALWVGRKLGLPVIYEIRAFWEDAAVDHGTYGPESWKYWLVRSIETWTCQRVAEVVVLCRGLKADLMARGIPSEKLTVVSNGISIDDFGTCKPDTEYREAWGLIGKKVIGFIGSFYHYEGLDLLVNAFGRLAACRSDVALLLAGGGRMEEELKAQIKKLHLDDRVVMPGRIPHQRIPGVYALVDILVYPRYSTRLTELVTPLKPLEGMAMGKALIASDIGGHRELIRNGQTGLLFPAGSISAMTEVLQRLLADEPLRQYLQRQGSTWVRQEHTWEKLTAVYADIYARALSGRMQDIILAVSPTKTDVV